MIRSENDRTNLIEEQIRDVHRMAEADARLAKCLEQMFDDEPESGADTTPVSSEPLHDQLRQARELAAQRRWKQRSQKLAVRWRGQGGSPPGGGGSG